MFRSKELTISWRDGRTNGYTSPYITLTLILQITTIVPYANSLDPYETPSKLGVSPGSKLFDTQTTFSPIFSNIAATWKSVADETFSRRHFIGRIRINLCYTVFISLWTTIYSIWKPTWPRRLMTAASLNGDSCTNLASNARSASPKQRRFTHHFEPGPWITGYLRRFWIPLARKYSVLGESRLRRLYKCQFITFLKSKKQSLLWAFAQE